VDQTTLVERDVAVGRRILEALARAGVSVAASSWLYFPELAEWQFFVATPLVDRKGPREAYGQVLAIMEKENLLSEFPLRRVFLISPGHPIAERIRENLREGEFQSQQVVNVAVGMEYVRNAYVYVGGSIDLHLLKDRGDVETNVYGVLFFPYAGPGGAVPVKSIGGMEELRRYLQTKLHIREEITNTVLERLRRGKTETIPNVQITPSELKRLGLAS
jgi:hypothetical protein